MLRIVNYINLTWHIKKCTLLAAMDNRTSFALQVLGTFLIDFCFLILWIIFFHQFPSLNGWTFQDTALLLAVSWFSYAANALLAGGIFKIAALIAEGDIDYYLLLPHNTLWNIAVVKTDLSALGNLCAMGTMLWLSGSVTIYKYIMFTITSLLSSGIFFNFIVIVQSLAFYLGPVELFAQQLLLTLINVLYYPPVIFSGIFHWIIITIIPAFFIGFLPVQLIKAFHLPSLMMLIGFWIVTTVLAYYVFFQGIKRYESGS